MSISLLQAFVHTRKKLICPIPLTFHAFFSIQGRLKLNETEHRIS